TSLQFAWSPFAGGTRAPRRAALRAEQDALRAEWEEARRGVALDVEAAFSEIAKARGAVAVAERGIALAEETLRVERERYASGRVTTNDLLDAEATLRSQRTSFEIARFNLIRAIIQLRLSVGEL